MAQTLRFDPADGRPDTALGLPWLSGFAVAGGLAFTVLVPIVVAIFAGFMILLSGALEWVLEILPGDEPAAEVEREYVLEEEDVIEARFVRLGIDFEDELPNRVVPIQSTAPPEPSEVPTDRTPTQRMERPERREQDPPDPVEDVLLRLGDRAQAFAEIAERRDLEGSPDGIEEGTETRATEGDLYRGRLYSFFRRGWSIPTTLSRDEVQGLTTTMDIQIGQDLEIVRFSVRRSSGNPIFDQSVEQQLTRLQASNQRIPPPPEEVADQYVGRPIAVRFHGRQAG